MTSDIANVTEAEKNAEDIRAEIQALVDDLRILSDQLARAKKSDDVRVWGNTISFREAATGATFGVQFSAGFPERVRNLIREEIKVRIRQVLVELRQQSSELSEELI